MSHFFQMPFPLFPYLPKSVILSSPLCGLLVYPAHLFSLCAPGQDESALSQSLSLLNSMSSAIYFHSPSFACSFLLALCSACVCSLACRWFGTAAGGVGGAGVGWWCLSRSSCAVRTNPSSCSEIRDNGAHERLLLPVPAPRAVCLSFLPFLPVTFSTESHAPGTPLCSWLAALSRRDVSSLDVSPAPLSYRRERSCLQELEFSTGRHISCRYFCVK